MITLQGHLKNITFQNQENAYTIAKFTTLHPQTTITVVGYLSGISPQDPMRIQGEWEKHTKYGQQFKISSFEIILPTRQDEIATYLKSLDIKGLTRKRIRHLIEQFQERTLEIIENQPEALKSIKGIGESLAAQIHEIWNERHATRKLVQFFQEYELPLSLTAPVMKKYGTLT